MNPRRSLLASWSICWILFFAAELTAQPTTWTLPNWNAPTFGGSQLWGDVHWHCDWRIQCHALTEHYRLLDNREHRRAWGTYESCLEQLESLCEAEEVPPVDGAVILLLHGLGGSRANMESLALFLEEETSCKAICIGYPSTRGNLSDHATTLEKIINRLEGPEEIHVVAHSMGNLVLRHYLADTTDPETGTQGDPRIGRIVMLGPPNHGAILADQLEETPGFDWVGGAAARQLTSAHWAETEQHLTTPQADFGIIAGHVAQESQGNPLLVEANDLMVTVEETKLVGAEDFCILPVAHFFMAESQQVQQRTATFLEHGYFVSPQEQQPITELNEADETLETVEPPTLEESE